MSSSVPLLRWSDQSPCSCIAVSKTRQVNDESDAQRTFTVELFGVKLVGHASDGWILW